MNSTELIPPHAPAAQDDGDSQFLLVSLRPVNPADGPTPAEQKNLFAVLLLNLFLQARIELASVTIGKPSGCAGDISRADFLFTVSDQSKAALAAQQALDDCCLLDRARISLEHDGEFTVVHPPAEDGAETQIDEALLEESRRTIAELIAAFITLPPGDQ